MKSWLCNVIWNFGAENQLKMREKKFETFFVYFATVCFWTSMFDWDQLTHGVGNVISGTSFCTTQDENRFQSLHSHLASNPT